MSYVPCYTFRRLNGSHRVFTSVSAFDGYVKEWRIAGFVVVFLGPFDCSVERSK